MPAVTVWPTLDATVEGRVIETDWLDFFARLERAGQHPFRGRMQQRGWSAARVEPPLRRDENVRAISALVLDYDGGIGLEEARAVWSVFFGLIHTTRKHTPSSPRFRVILPFSREVTREEYAVLWRYVVRLSGHRVDAVTRDASRFWYLPGPLEGHEFVALRLEGVVLDPDPLLREADEADAAARVSTVTRIHPSAESRADRYAQAALDAERNAVALAAQGTRNARLFVAACKAGNFLAAGHLTESYALDRLEAAARVCGLGALEARRAILNGIARGVQEPRTIPPPTAAQEAAMRAPYIPPYARPEPPPPPPGAEPEPPPEPPPNEAERAEAPHELDALWRTVGEWGLLDRDPPPREWLLMRPSTETNGHANPVGLLPLGELGVLLAAGGVGKSFTLMQLALSIATGRPWLEHFVVPKPGRVLVMLGEEKRDEAHRRMHELASAMRLTDTQRELVKRNVVLMPLAGVIAPFVVQTEGFTEETTTMRYLRKRLGEGEWRLVIIDPLSRFAGADTEKDNAQATRFIQVVESLCQAPGTPTVLFSHHTNKTSRANETAPNAADSRGATALTDGARFSLSLARREEGVALNITKNNLAEEWGETTHLVRAPGGALRVERPAEHEARREAVEDALRAKVIAALRAEPGLSKALLRERCGARNSEVSRLVDAMKAAGELTESPKHHYHLRTDDHAG